MSFMFTFTEPAQLKKLILTSNKRKNQQDSKNEFYYIFITVQLL